MRSWLTKVVRCAARRAARQDGYSLPEVLVAAVILVIGIGGLMYLFADSGKGSQTSSRQDLAAAIATQELESMRSYPYSALALNQSVTSLPDARLVNGGTQFQALSSTAEDLVSPAVPCGGSVSTSCSPFQAMTRATAPGGTGYTVYRVISWADQSCPLSSAALTKLSNALAALYTAVGTVEATLSTLNGNGSTPGLITQAQSTVQGLINSLLGGLLQSLLTEYQALQSDITRFSSLVSNSLPTGLQSELSKIQTDLTNLQRENLIDGSGHLTITSLDPCHLPKLTSLLSIPDIDQLTNLTNALTGASVGVENYLAINNGNAQAELTAVASWKNGAQDLGTVTNTDAALSGDNTSISSNAGLSSTSINAVHSGLTSLNNILNCVNNLAGCSMTGTHVQKRISVAVVLDGARAGVGPQKAVWMSSLVSDPADGLL